MSAKTVIDKLSTITQHVGVAVDALEVISSLTDSAPAGKAADILEVAGQVAKHTLSALGRLVDGDTESAEKLKGELDALRASLLADIGKIHSDALDRLREKFGK